MYFSQSPLNKDIYSPSWFWTEKFLVARSMLTVVQHERPRLTTVNGGYMSNGSPSVQESLFGSNKLFLWELSSNQYIFVTNMNLVGSKWMNFLQTSRKGRNVFIFNKTFLWAREIAFEKIPWNVKFNKVTIRLAIRLYKTAQYDHGNPYNKSLSIKLKSA